MGSVVGSSWSSPFLSRYFTPQIAVFTVTVVVHLSETLPQASSAQNVTVVTPGSNGAEQSVLPSLRSQWSAGAASQLSVTLGVIVTTVGHSSPGRSWTGS